VSAAIAADPNSASGTGRRCKATARGDRTQAAEDKGKQAADD
jgi:hypothetical protein